MVPPTVAPFTGLVMLTAGSVLSTVTLTAAEMPKLPAASDACAVRLCPPSVPVVVAHDALNGASVSVLSNTPSTKNCTWVTPTLSDAVAEIGMDPLTVAPSAGPMILAIGGVVSEPPVERVISSVKSVSLLSLWLSIANT